MNWFVTILAAILIAACSNSPTTPATTQSAPSKKTQKGNEVVLYAMNLMDRDYKFGGKNPDTGLDCSGMVSYIYQQAVGLTLPHNAKQLAQAGKEIKPSELEPGDLVFFNTSGLSFSHVGIYIGDDRFIHAPKQNGKIRIDHLKSGYFKNRFEAARTFFY